MDSMVEFSVSTEGNSPRASSSAPLSSPSSPSSRRYLRNTTTTSMIRRNNTTSMTFRRVNANLSKYFFVVASVVFLLAKQNLNLTLTADLSSVVSTFDDAPTTSRVISMLRRLDNNYGQLSMQQHQQESNQRRTLHMIQCVYGSAQPFIDEWEVSFKSLIFNAPLDSNLHVHILCNQAGRDSILHVIQNKTELQSSYWRNNVTVTVNNIDTKEENIREFLTSHILYQNQSQRRWMDRRLGLGAWLRLFAYKYIEEYVNYEPTIQYEEKDLRQAVYIDSDVVIISNLNHLMKTMDETVLQAELQQKPRPTWVWGGRCTGLLGINLLEFDRVWDAVKACDGIRDDGWPKKNDQWLLQHVVRCDVNETLFMDLPNPNPWDTQIGNGYRSGAHALGNRQEGVGAGMLHLQIPDANNWFDPQEAKNENFNRYVDKFCQRGKRCSKNMAKNLDIVRNTWGLADFYLRISWDWAIYQAGTSRIAPDENGHAFELVVRDVQSNFTPWIQQYRGAMSVYNNATRI